MQISGIYGQTDSHLNNPEKIHGRWEYHFRSPIFIRHNGTAIMDGATYFQINHARFKRIADIIVQKTKRNNNIK